MERVISGRQGTTMAPSRAAVSAIGRGTSAAPAPASTRGRIASRLARLDRDPRDASGPCERVVEQPAIRRSGRRHDERPLREVAQQHGRLDGRGVRREDHDEVLGAERVHDEAGLVRRVGGLGDRELGVTGAHHHEQVGRIVRVVQLDDDRGVCGPEPPDDRRRRVHGEGAEAGDRETSAFETAHGQDRRGGGLQVAQRLTGRLEQRLAHGGQADPAPDAVEERHAELGLEGPDRLRQRRLGHVGGGGAAGHAALVDDGDEHFEPPQIHT